MVNKTSTVAVQPTARDPSLDVDYLNEEANFKMAKITEDEEMQDLPLNSDEINEDPSELKKIERASGVSAPKTKLRRHLERWSWYLYDAANSAYVTQVASTFLPRYFQQVAAAQLPENEATNIWGVGISIMYFISAILSPPLGAIADEFGKRKLLLIINVLLGCIFCALLFFIEQNMYILCLVFFGISRVTYGLADSLYNSLLVFITNDEKEMNDVSSMGYIIGYLGGGLLLSVFLGLYVWLNSVWVIKVNYPVVAIWWLLLTIPMMIFVPEAPSSTIPQVTEEKPNLLHRIKHVFVVIVACVQASNKRLVHTLKEIVGFKHLFIFLVAFWFFNDGISTIISMAVAFAGELKDERTGEQMIHNMHLFLAMLAVQFLGIPFTFLFIPIANKIGSKIAILIGIVVYTGLTIWGYWLGKYSIPGLSLQTTAVIHFWSMAVLISMVQGSVQALSRSMFAQLSPRSKSSEFFGLFGLSGKFAGIFGPLMFSLTSWLVGNSRGGLLSVAAFFVIGFVLLLAVKVDKGKEYAEKFEEAQKNKLFNQLASVQNEQQSNVETPQVNTEED